jgi:glutamate/tyrosine decarboxylase-like PLP-dependent enzyme
LLARFRDGLPDTPVSLDSIFDRLAEVASLSNYNGHPRWLAYVTASPTPVGVIGDFIASAMNPNLGLWRGGPAPTAVEAQSIDWLKELLGFPPQAEGIYTSGGQFANIVAHAVIRNQMAGCACTRAPRATTASCRRPTCSGWAPNRSAWCPSTTPTECGSTR